MSPITYLLYILTSSISAITPVLVESLLSWHQNNPNILLKHFQPHNFCRYLHLNQKQTSKFLHLFASKSFTQFASELQNYQIKTSNIFEHNYPTLLKQIPDPPLLLYWRGQLTAHNNFSYSIAIVGSRKPSNYGINAVQQLTKGLKRTNLTIVSGLAYGIDATAHQQALQNNLKTIAVLGSGLDDPSIYPYTHLSLAHQILTAGGLLISEYPPQTEARKHQFIARNRIIAGLSQLTAIIECTKNSGALITADFALDYNRTIFALPGSIFSATSIGPNQLLKQGANILTNATDILQALNIEQPQASANQALTNSQQLVLNCIQQNYKEFEQLISQTNLSVSQLTSILAELKLNQLIHQSNPQTYETNLL
jgi:DNA processing protein